MKALTIREKIQDFELDMIDDIFEKPMPTSLRWLLKKYAGMGVLETDFNREEQFLIVANSLEEFINGLFIPEEGLGAIYPFVLFASSTNPSISRVSRYL